VDFNFKNSIFFLKCVFWEVPKRAFPLLSCIICLSGSSWTIAGFLCSKLTYWSTCKLQFAFFYDNPI